MIRYASQIIQKRNSTPYRLNKISTNHESFCFFTRRITNCTRESINIRVHTNNTSIPASSTSIARTMCCYKNNSKDKVLMLMRTMNRNYSNRSRNRNRNSTNNKDHKKGHNKNTTSKISKQKSSSSSSLLSNTTKTKTRATKSTTTNTRMSNNNSSHQYSKLDQLHKILLQFKPKINRPGGGGNRGTGSGNTKELLKESLKRLPLFGIILYILMETMPISIDCMSGPSMIPTIYPMGEIYLRLRTDTSDSLWNKLCSFIWKRNDNGDNNPSDIDNNDTINNDTNDDHQVDSGNHSTSNKSKTKNTKLNTTKLDVDVGDLVIIKDYKGTFACKRIIGIEGDVVWRYGEYAIDLYSNEDDFGIKEIHSHGSGSGRGRGSAGSSIGDIPEIPSWEDNVKIIHVSTSTPTPTPTPTPMTGQPQLIQSVVLNKDVKETTSKSKKISFHRNNANNSHEDKKNVYTKVIIPKGHIWVEGDNPLYSIDSRHYGPIPIENVFGKLIYRLWPRVKQQYEKKDEYEHGYEEEHHRNDSISCFISKNRPHPLTEDEMLNGPYGVFKVPNIEKGR